MFFKLAQLLHRLSKSNETNAHAFFTISSIRVNNLNMFLKVLKFELDQICIQTLFDHNLSFVAPFELILFANRSSWPKLSDKAKFT